MRLLNLGLLLGLALTPFYQTNTAPQLSLVGADSDKNVNLDTATSNWEAVLFLEETANQAVTDLELTISPLHGPSPGQVEIDWSLGARGQTVRSEPVAVPPLGIVEIRVRALLPVVGKYTGTLGLRYAGRRETYTLTVERKSPTVAFSLAGLPVGPLPVGPFGDRPLPLQLTLAETTGQVVQVYPPVVELARLDSDDAATQAEVGRIEILDEASRPLVLDPDGTLTLGAYEVRTLSAVLYDVPRAGRYRATVQAQTPEGTRAETVLTVRLRHHWGFALVVILAGVIGSWLLRQWRSGGRARASLSVHLARLDEDIAQYPELADDPVVKLFRTRVGQMRRDLATGLTVDEAQANASTQAWRVILELVGMERSVAALPADLADPLRSSLADVRQALARWDAASVKTAQETLAQVSTQLPAAQRVARLRPLQTLIAELERRLADFPDAPLADELQAALKNAQQALSQAQTGGVVDVVQVYDRTRRVYLDALLADLQARLPEAPPQGVSDDWEQVRGRIERELAQIRQDLSQMEDLDTVEQRYEQVLGQVLEPLLPALQVQIAQLQKSLAALQQSGASLASETALQSALDAAAQAQQLAEHCQDQVEQGDLAGALLDFDRARRQHAAALKALGQATGGVMDDRRRGKGVPMLPVPSPRERFRPAPAGVPRRSTLPDLPSLRGLRYTLLLKDSIATLATAVLSSLVGLQLLWVGNPTFGSLGDYITVLLWGFGLHQLSEVTRQAGPAAIAATLGSGTQSPPQSPPAPQE
jgi:hypothetical protein